MDLGLKGKSVLITGASKGIGAAVAQAFAAEGGRLHLAARDPEALQVVAGRLRAEHGATVDIHAVDLRRSEDVARLAVGVGALDILVNNAGDIPGGSLEKVDEGVWRHAWDLKVLGYINLTRLVYAGMKARGHGVIVNDIGTAGEKPSFDYIAGSTGNAALMAFTRALGGRSLDDNIRVVGVNPGPVETERSIMLNKKRALDTWGDESRYVEFVRAMPLGRRAKPSEVADLIVFLASARAGYVSGSIHTIDGGASTRG